MSVLLATTEAVRVGKFGAVGILNTLLDFGIYNALTTKRIGLTKLRANVVSTTITMIISFFLQRQVVFGSGQSSPLLQAIKFFAVTAFGLYILQNIVIYLFTKSWKWPKNLVHAVLKKLPKIKYINDDFVVKNGAKVAATLVSLTWNYIMYKRVVFK